MTGRSHTNEMRFVEKTPVIDTSAYAANDLIGSEVIKLEGVGDNSESTGGLIQSVIITDKKKQNVNIDVVFFDADPTATTFSDNDIFAPADADLVNILGVATVTDYKTFSTNSVGQALQQAIPFVQDTGNTLYAALVSRGAGTYLANSLTLRVGVIGD